MNRHLLGENLDVFPQNSTFYTNPKDKNRSYSKIDVTLKSFLAMEFFDYSLNQPFP